MAACGLYQDADLTRADIAEGVVDPDDRAAEPPAGLLRQLCDRPFRQWRVGVVGQPRQRAVDGMNIGPGTAQKYALAAGGMRSPRSLDASDGVIDDPYVDHGSWLNGGHRIHGIRLESTGGFGGAAPARYVGGMDRSDGLPPDNCLGPTLGDLGDQPRAALDQLASLGFRSVQLSATQPGLRPRELDRSARRDLRVKLRRLEMDAAGLDLWIPASHFVTPSTSDRAVDAVRAAIELAADLGRCPVCLSLPGDDDDGRLGPIAGTIIDHAIHRGVMVADHAVRPASHEPIGVGIDPPAWLALGEDPIAGVTTFADRLVSLRLADLMESGMRAPIGVSEVGRLDVAAYRKAIATCGYRGPLVIDMRGWPDPWAGLAQTARTWMVCEG